MYSGNFIIPLVVYPFDVMISVGESDKQVRSAVRKRLHADDFTVFDGDPHLFHMVNGCHARTVHNPFGGQTVIRFESEPDHGIVAHEIFHAVNYVLTRVGITLSQDSDEAYAYLLHYVVSQYYEKVK